MNFDSEKKILSVETSEPFGRVLIEQMFYRPDKPEEKNVRVYIGAVLTKAYLDKEIDNALSNIDDTRSVIHEDIAKDISQKIVLNAMLNSVKIDFPQEYFTGLESISRARAEELRDLEAELEITEVASEIGYVNSDGSFVDEQDVEIVGEEIEQAKAARIVLELIKKAKKG